MFGDGSDIKVPWELSRFQHLPLLAAAHRLTGDARYLDEIGAQLRSWIARNPVEHGPNWACTMDVAIRAANWVAALVMCCESAAREPWFDGALRSLLLHGRFIRSHLEYGEIRGNHYLSDIVGLLPVAAVFSGSAEGRRWSRWAAAELVREMEHQVRPDGSDHEASIPYHRLVTELFVCGTQAADALAPGALTPGYRARLDAMLRFTAAYTRPDGDAADGRRQRLGPLPAARRLRHGLPLAPPPVRAGRAGATARRRPRRVSGRRATGSCAEATCGRSCGAATSGCTDVAVTPTTMH